MRAEASRAPADEGRDVGLAEDRLEQLLVDHRRGGGDADLGAGQAAGVDEDRQDRAGADRVDADAGHLRPALALLAERADLVADPGGPGLEVGLSRSASSGDAPHSRPSSARAAAP